MLDTPNFQGCAQADINIVSEYDKRLLPCQMFVNILKHTEGIPGGLEC
jgi:hypothetical protein